MGLTAAFTLPWVAAMGRMQGPGVGLGAALKKQKVFWGTTDCVLPFVPVAKPQHLAALRLRVLSLQLLEPAGV